MDIRDENAVKAARYLKQYCSNRQDKIDGCGCDGCPLHVQSETIKELWFCTLWISAGAPCNLDLEGIAN